jgi:hypothetical protein
MGACEGAVRRDILQGAPAASRSPTPAAYVYYPVYGWSSER